MKYLILGGRSFLGRSFYYFLKKNRIHAKLLHEENSNFYSPISLKNIIKKERPQKIVDFKFPIVSSNDEDFKNIDLKAFSNTQEALIESLNQLPEISTELFLVSSINIKNRKNIYTKNKKKQEDYYKKYLPENNKFKIIRLENVLGQGDLNTYRLVPFFFTKVFQNESFSLNIDSNKKGLYIFIDDCNKYLYNTSINKSYRKNIFNITYKELIFRLSSILEFEFEVNHKILWNGKKIINNKIDQRAKFNQNLIELTGWYLKNKTSLSVHI
jgi:hypothetical protein